MLKNKKYSSISLLILLIAILFNADAFPIELKRNKFKVKIIQVINYNFPYLSIEETQKVLSIAKLRKNSVCDSHAQCPPGMYCEPYIGECKYFCQDEFVKDTEFRFKEEFNKVLCNMIKNYWDESGDWKDDGMGDSTTFAPLVLFDLAERLKQPELSNMAVRTVEWEVQLFQNMMDQILKGEDPQKMMETVNGIPALIAGYYYTKNKRYSNLVKTALIFAENIATTNPDMFTYFLFDRVTVPAVLSYIGFLYSKISGEKLYSKKALRLINFMDEKYWDENEATYGEKEAWSTPFIINSLIEAYLAASDKKYLERANLILSNAEKDLWKEDGFYIEDGTYFGLAENINFVHTYLNFFEVTKEQIYLDKAEKLIKHLFDNRLFDSEKGMIYHDFRIGSGRSDYFCTGCNFCTLIAILRMNDILKFGKSKFFTTIEINSK